MQIIIRLIKFIIVAVLSIVYWPINVLFQYLKKHYFKWKKEDRISFILATPIYYICFIIVAALSVPLEIFGEGLHPPLGGFR
jgi:hypothetical protein